MRKYGGVVEQKTEMETEEEGYEYEFNGDYKYISVKHLNEIMSQADEYQSMFKEYFEVSNAGY